MRKIIGYEKVEKIPGQLILEGAFKWNETEPIPVTTHWSRSMDHPQSIIGKATDLRREEDGAITAEIDIPDYPEYFEHFSFTVYANKVHPLHPDDDGLWRVETATIREVFGIANHAFPEAGVPW